MDVFKHTSIPLSKRNGRAYVSYQMLAYRRDCTVLLKQYFFKGSVARGSKSAERERGRERERSIPLMGNRIALGGEEIMTRLKDRAISTSSRRDVYKVYSIFLPFLIVILTSRSSYDNSYFR